FGQERGDANRTGKSRSVFVRLTYPVATTLVPGNLRGDVEQYVIEELPQALDSCRFTGRCWAEDERSEPRQDLVVLFPELLLCSGIDHVGAYRSTNGVAINVHLEQVRLSNLAIRKARCVRRGDNVFFP